MSADPPAAVSPIALPWVPARAWLPLLALALVAVWLAGFPVARLPLGVGLVAAGALIAWRPAWLLTIAAAALPVLDLAPWSGRWLVDEYDALLLLGTSLAWARLPAPNPRRSARRQHDPVQRAPGRRLALPLGLTLACGAVLLSLAAAAAHTVWPLPAWDADSISNPMSPLNALRIAKGGLWALLLTLLARRMAGHGLDAGAAFGRGLVLGLAGTVAAVVAERLAFSYLLDFVGEYRIAGPMAAMSLGGAYIECFIAVATPFLLVRLLPPAPLWQMGGGAVLLAGASYALMITFSRGGYAAMALGVVVVLVAVLVSPTRRWRQVLAGTAMAALAGAVAWPILTGSYAQQRLEALHGDLGIRERHWAQGLRLMDDSANALLFGMGLGRVPELFFWRGPEGERAGGHRLITNADGSAQLRLGAGEGYYIDQIVPVQPGQRYRVSYRVRSLQPGGPLPLGLCQKWIVASIECSSPQTSTPAAADAQGWQAVNTEIIAPPTGPGRLPRPVRLTLHNAGKRPVEVTQLSLTAPDGQDLLRNGDFRAGLDHWTWTSDQHLAWHTKSLPLGLYVEQGLLGLAAMSALLLLGVLAAARAAREGRHDAAATLAALCAFCTVGSIDTLLDVPRYLMLWLLLCLLPGMTSWTLTSGDRHHRLASRSATDPRRATAP